MTVSTEHLEQLGSVFSRLWDERDLDAVRPLYREDAVFISPNPPGVGGFGTVLEGRDEIMRYYAACLEIIPPGAVTTVAVLTGIDMAVWVWRAGLTGTGADVMSVDGDGLIFRQQVTAPTPD